MFASAFNLSVVQELHATLLLAIPGEWEAAFDDAVRVSKSKSLLRLHSKSP